MKSNVFKVLIGVMIVVTVVSLGAYVMFSVKDDSAKTYTDEFYNEWRKNYVSDASFGMSRVVDTESNNCTVSEGIGYGMLFSAAMDDKFTFKKLWKYSQKYLDQNGLMNWKIDANGYIIGKGSATDADEDIAYALMYAGKKWGSDSYTNDALKMLKAIRKCEIGYDYLLLPGDSWGDSRPFNPSYVAPLYYKEFATFDTEKKGYWNSVLNKNMHVVADRMNSDTGFLPDWIRQDGRVEKKDDIIGYESVRVSIRQIPYYKKTKDSDSEKVLEKQNKFLSAVGADKLTAAYSTSGHKTQEYINSTYLASYTASSFIHPFSDFSKAAFTKLIDAQDTSYYGSSLKMWVLLLSENRIY